MSRSRRKTPVCGITTAKTEKQDKRIANRRVRRSVRQEMKTDPSAEVLPLKREVSDVWAMDKDGKVRFDPEQHPETMRK